MCGSEPSTGGADRAGGDVGCRTVSSSGVWQMADSAPHAMAAVVSVCVLLSWCWQWAGRCSVTSRGHGPRRGLQHDDDTLPTKPAHT